MRSGNSTKSSQPRMMVARGILVTIFVAATLMMAGCGDQSSSPSRPGIPKLAVAPKVTQSLLGQLYFNTTDGKEYIFDGQEWVPHDSSIDTYASPKSTQLPGDNCTDELGNNICPDSLHIKHSAFMTDCQGCHTMSLSGLSGLSLLWFSDNTKPAWLTPATAPVFSKLSTSNGRATGTASCSNIACHSLSSATNGGSFSYYFGQDGEGLPVLQTVTYGGTITGGSVNWVSTNLPSANCDACHGNPPVGAYHATGAGGHAGTIPGAQNCEFCHPNVVLKNGKPVIINKAMHRNGIIDIKARYKSTCFNCH